MEKETKTRHLTELPGRRSIVSSEKRQYHEFIRESAESVYRNIRLSATFTEKKQLFQFPRAFPVGFHEIAHHALRIFHSALPVSRNPFSLYAGCKHSSCGRLQVFASSFFSLRSVEEPEGFRIAPKSLWSNTHN